MRFVEDEFFRRTDAGQKRGMRDEKNDDSDNAARRDRHAASSDNNIRV
jgi:hypothetical protein